MNILQLTALTVGLGLGATGLAQGATLPTPTELFARHVAAIGGRDALLACKTVTVTGTSREGASVGDFTLQAKAPGLTLLTRTDSSGHSIREGRGPDARFWKQDSSGIANLDDGAASELSALVRPLLVSTFLELQERLADAVCEADQEGNRRVVAIGRKGAPGLFPRFVFDADTGLLVRAGTVRFSDYRAVAGVKVPFLLRADSNHVYAVTTVRFNDLIADSVFQRPGGQGSLLAQFIPRMTPELRLHTLLSATGKTEIVRQPVPMRFGRGRLPKLPSYDPVSGRHAQVDLRSYDLSQLDLTGRLVDLLHADFDSQTRWPASLPTGFDRDKIMELGKDPGLGVRRLHARGITGKGIGVGVIDQTLLTDHREYAGRLRLYEEIHCLAGAPAQLHGPAVASIAVGKTCGVAPEADLYYIAEQHGTFVPGKDFDWDFKPLAESIDRLLEVNASLPTDRRMRVISISVGWSPGQKGYDEAMAAVKRAAEQRVFVISTAIRETHRLTFDGLDREALADPNVFENYGPGSWWASLFWGGQMRFKPSKRLCVPMDSRTIASPTGPDDYVHYSSAGWSWSVPWIAGLYALACQVYPDITPEKFWAEALRTGKTIRLHHSGEEIDFGTLADPEALVEALQRLH